MEETHVVAPPLWLPPTLSLPHKGGGDESGTNSIQGSSPPLRGRDSEGGTPDDQALAPLPEPQSDAATLVTAGILDQGFPAFIARTSAMIRLLGSGEFDRLGAAIAAPDAPIGIVIRRP